MEEKNYYIPVMRYIFSGVPLYIVTFMILRSVFILGEKEIYGFYIVLLIFFLVVYILSVGRKVAINDDTISFHRLILKKAIMIESIKQLTVERGSNQRYYLCISYRIGEKELAYKYETKFLKRIDVKEIVDKLHNVNRNIVVDIILKVTVTSFLSERINSNSDFNREIKIKLPNPLGLNHGLNNERVENNIIYKYEFKFELEDYYQMHEDMKIIERLQQKEKMSRSVGKRTMNISVGAILTFFALIFIRILLNDIVNISYIYIILSSIVMYYIFTKPIIKLLRRRRIRNHFETQKINDKRNIVDIGEFSINELVNEKKTYLWNDISRVFISSTSIYFLTIESYLIVIPKKHIERVEELIDYIGGRLGNTNCISNLVI